MDNTVLAFLMSVIAGLATGIGSLIALFAKSTNKTFLAVSLGFSAGVMLYVSTVEIMSGASETLVSVFGAARGGWVTAAAFFGGMIVMAVIERVVPSPETKKEQSLPLADSESAVRDIKRTGVIAALAIAIHNFPEGIATFVSALAEPDVAAPIVVAIAIHNIPEGIAVSAPIYAATRSRGKAFAFSLLSGLAEPVGALFGWLILMPIMSDVALGVIFAAVAGIMVFISIDELLPAAREAKNGCIVTYGAVIGMAVMAVSLILFV